MKRTNMFYKLMDVIHLLFQRFFGGEGFINNKAGDTERETTIVQ